MSVRRAATIAMTTLAVAALAGCGPSLRFGMPDARIRPVEAPDEAFGHEADVSTHVARYHGELVACDDEHVFLFLATSKGTYVRLSWPAIQKINVKLKERGGTVGGLSTWTAVGQASSLSHGFLAIITSPLWAVLATPTLVIGVMQHFKSGTCKELAPYARYPQGLPAPMKPRFTTVTATGEPAPQPEAPLPQSPPEHPAPPP